MTGRTYTHPDVFTAGVAEGWAEAETDPARIDWPARQARAAIPFEVVDGRPVNPCERTGVRYGRNEMGFWGEQLMADALVTVTCQGARFLLMVERDDGYGWAVPGGHVEPGETGLAAAVRELAEETSLSVPASACRARTPRYVPDPRASDEAWAVTVPVHIDFGPLAGLPFVAGGDDARRAEWIPAGTYDQLTASLSQRFGGRVFTAHTAMLAGFLEDRLMAGIPAELAAVIAATSAYVQAEGPNEDYPGGGFVPEAERRRYIQAALTGVELGTYDRRILGWVAQWDDYTARLVVSLLVRARRAGYEAGEGR